MVTEPGRYPSIARLPRPTSLRWVIPGAFFCRRPETDQESALRCTSRDPVPPVLAISALVGSVLGEVQTRLSRPSDSSTTARTNARRPVLAELGVQAEQLAKCLVKAGCTLGAALLELLADLVHGGHDLRAHTVHHEVGKMPLKKGTLRPLSRPRISAGRGLARARRWSAPLVLLPSVLPVSDWAASAAAPGLSSGRLGLLQE